MSLVTAFAAPWPSLFRGVVVAESDVGVRVVSVEDASQARLADLRSEDLIVSIDGEEVRSIDQFAGISLRMKGHAARTTLTILRHGAPRELTLHLYSYPILRTWRLEFIPDHDVRFAQPQTGLAYWARLGRGFEEAGKLPEALDAYLNGLHNAPEDLATAMTSAELCSRLGQDALRHGWLAEGVASLRHAVILLEQLFDRPLSDEQLQTIKRQLQDTLAALRSHHTG